MLKETQSRKESTNHTEESQEKKANMIDSPEPEEAESLMTRRADMEDSTMETSQLTSQRTKMEMLLKKSRKRRLESTKSLSQSQSQRWSNSLSPSMKLWLQRPDLVKRKPEVLKLSREPKFKRAKLIRQSNPLFCKTSMLKILLPPQPMPTTSILVSDQLAMTMMFHPEEEEVEAEEAAEGAVEMLELLEVVLEDKTQSKPSRRLKMISQHYERDGDPL
jgi:hypothetical protein